MTEIPQPSMEDLERAFEVGLTGAEAWKAAIKRREGEKLFLRQRYALTSENPNALGNYADWLREK